MNEVTVYDKHDKDELRVVDAKTIRDFLFSTDTKLSEKQQAMFMQLAIRNQLDPFKREIYAIPYGNDFNIVTAYQVYIKRAEATGKLDGWECVATHDEKGNLSGAKITIYRKDFLHPFIWEVSLAEFKKEQTSWKRMPEFMIKKVCIGQGFRLAFPNELGGLPYLQEELEGLVPENTKPPIEPPRAKIDNPKEMDTETETIITHIEDIRMKRGGEGKKTWTKYIIFAGEQEYSTFSKTIATTAKKAMEMGLESQIVFKATRFGNEIVEFNLLEVEEEGRVENERVENEQEPEV